MQQHMLIHMVVTLQTQINPQFLTEKTSFHLTSWSSSLNNLQNH